MKRRFVNEVFRVRFFRFTITSWPFTVTFAEILLPGKTLSLTGTDAAGTSSYQTPYVARPLAVQSDSVPICSSPCEVSAKPPSPTQNAENEAGLALQLATGTTQEPETLEYAAGVAGSTDETA
jgi:hypothetical protein